MLTKRQTRLQAPVVSAAVQAFLDKLKPGETLDLVLNPEGSHSFDVRRAPLLDISPERGLVVSQPNRKIVKTAEPPAIEATILRHDHQINQYIRLGFYTTVKEFLDSFHLVGSSEEALILELPREIHQANLRASFRLLIPPSFVPPTALLSENKKKLDISIELIDLATGGASLCYRYKPGTPPLFTGGETIFFEADFSDLIERMAVRLYAFQAELAHFQARCRVVRTYEEPDTRRRYVAVAFRDLTGPQEDLLHALILKMQMFISSRGLA
jgi:hypothetical protein